MSNCKETCDRLIATLQDKVKKLENKLTDLEVVNSSLYRMNDELRESYQEQCLINIQNEKKLESERKAANGFCEALNRERLAHGKTEAQLVEKNKMIAEAMVALEKIKGEFRELSIDGINGHYSYSLICRLISKLSAKEEKEAQGE